MTIDKTTNNIRYASVELWNEYHDHLWFVAVGEGLNNEGVCLFLYVKKITKDLKIMFKDGWSSFDVILRVM